MALHRFPSLALKSRIDARWHCDDDLQAEPFSFAATKNRIERGRSPSLRLLQAKPFFVAAKKISIGRGPRCLYDCSRRNHSPSRQRKLESEADLVAATTVAGGTILHRHNDCAAVIPKSGPEIKNRCTQEGLNREKLASILKSGLEIKNRCTQEGLNGEILASIRKSGLEIKNRCRKQPIFSTHPQHIPCTSSSKRSSRVEDASCLGGLHGHGHDAGLPVAAKAGADAPGGGISLSFCRRGCAAPAQKAATLSASASPVHIPQHAFHHALKTRLALEVCMGTGTTQVRQWRQKRVLMRPEAAFPYVFAAEGAQHPPKKPPRSAPPLPGSHPAPHPAATAAAEVQSFIALGV